MPKLRYSEFKHRIDIDRLEEAIGFDVLRQDRGNDIGTCPFPENHQNGDTTGKFAIHREMMVYNCWVCDGGDMVSLAMELYDFDVDQATEWLYQFASGAETQSDLEFRDYLLDMLADVEERSESMPYFNERVLERQFSQSSPEMFADRGISEEVARRYKLSYGNPVLRSAPVKHIGAEIQKIDEDYYGPALVFPHYWQDRLVGWQTRWMDWDDGVTTPKWLAKYTNTTDFPKHNTLFNYDTALKAKEPVVVVESVPTALFLVSNGYPAVSYFGGDKMKDAQLRLLRRFQQGVILAPDNDKTGERFVSSGVQYLEKYIPVYVAEPVDMGPKADLGDYARTENPSHNLHEHMTKRVHLSGVEI